MRYAITNGASFSRNNYANLSRIQEIIKKEFRLHLETAMNKLAKVIPIKTKKSKKFLIQCHRCGIRGGGLVLGG